jgi:transcriptional regulator with XRE-family HTH domain
MPGRRRRVDGIAPEQSAVVGANIRALRLRNGWTQAKLGELMGWPTNATVCAAEGHRAGRQRGFSAAEVKRLAGIFGVSPRDLTTSCVTCGGRPPTGFACLTCGATPELGCINRVPGPSASNEALNAPGAHDQRRTGRATGSG